MIAANRLVNSKGPTKGLQVLRFISRGTNGVNGVRFVDIQRYACEQNGLNFDERLPGTCQRRYRGYWCDYLLSGGYPVFRPGLLSSYCDKLPNGRYVLNKEGKELLKNMENF